MVRAKFKVESYETHLDHQSKDELRNIKLTPVTGSSEENKKFFRWTPFGKIEIGTLNPEAWKQFPLGAEVYVDFNLVEDTDVRPKA